MPGIKKSRNEIPTIDVNLVTIETAAGEFGFDTANQIEVEVQTETEEAVRLVVKGRLRAQKPETKTITGHEITLHDNVFNPELVKTLQGGIVTYWKDAGHTDIQTIPSPFGVAKYTPPVAGSGEKGEVFKLNAYSAIYNAAGLITGYEKTTYPNCQGSPVAFNSQDGTFRAPEYTIISAPDEGEAPYEIVFVDELPELEDPDALGELTVTSAEGTNTGDTVITVNPALTAGNSYRYKVSGAPIPVTALTNLTGWNTWDGTAELTGQTAGDSITVVEANASGRPVNFGSATLVVKE